MSEDLKLNLTKTKTGLSLTVAYGKVTNKKLDFWSAAIARAKQVKAEAKQRPIALLIDNSCESAALLEIFLRAKVKFKAMTLSFKGIENPIEKNWKKWLKSKGVNLAAFEFNYKDPDHLKALTLLQKQTEAVDMKSLFNIWVSCQTEDYIVIPGQFCLPILLSNDRTDWELPGLESVALYNFAEQFGGVSNFFVSSYSLFLSQAQSELSSALVNLYRKDRLWFSDITDAKKIFLKFHGFKFAKQLPVTVPVEPYWRLALRLQDRNELETTSGIIKRFRLALSIPLERTVSCGKLKLPAEKSVKTRKLLIADTKNLVSVDYAGGLKDISVPGESNHRSYVAFPVLITEHIYKGNLEKELEAVRGLEFFKNPGNWVSESDLHLRKEFTKLNSFFKEQIGTYFKEYGYAVHDFEITQCWASRLEKGDVHHQHFHTNSLLSGIFYLTEGQGGETVFSKQISNSSSVVPTDAKYTLWNSRTASFQPKKGHLLLFPSDLLHHVTGNMSHENRYTLAFNVFPRGNIGEFSRATWLKL